MARAQSARGGPDIGGTLGAYLEDNIEVGNATQLRLPVPLVLSLGSPRRAQLDIEPAWGWFSAPGVPTVSGISYSRVRLFYFFGAANRFSIGPDVEAYLKTERVLPLGFGYDRIMPGIQASYKIKGDFRTILRVRYEGSLDEDSGVSKLRRIAVRPSVYLPRAGAVTSWLRSDILIDIHGAPTQYNVEGYAGLGVGPTRRLTLFVEPRVYVGAASRTKNLWRLRSGLTWSLGGLTVHRPPQSSERDFPERAGRWPW
ncbi:MAG TPA: hypothetical protein VGI92_06550 [Gemmatimonadales bacterium]